MIISDHKPVYCTFRMRAVNRNNKFIPPKKVDISKVNSISNGHIGNANLCQPSTSKKAYWWFGFYLYVFCCVLLTTTHINIHTSFCVDVNAACCILFYLCQGQSFIYEWNNTATIILICFWELSFVHYYLLLYVSQCIYFIQYNLREVNFYIHMFSVCIKYINICANF